MRSLKSKLKKAKENKAKIKQDALDVEIKLKTKIAELMCQIEDKSLEHERLVNKDIVQLTKSTIVRLKKKIYNVKDKMRKKVSNKVEIYLK